MRVEKDGNMTWYYGEGEHASLRACVTKSGEGYYVHAIWPDPIGGSRMGGYGELEPIALDEATDLATRFVTGKRVPEELGGYDDNGPPAQRRPEVAND